MVIFQPFYENYGPDSEVDRGDADERFPLPRSRTGISIRTELRAAFSPAHQSGDYQHAEHTLPEKYFRRENSNSSRACAAGALSRVAISDEI